FIPLYSTCSSHCALQDRHPFPTRRSSDLEEDRPQLSSRRHRIGEALVLAILEARKDAVVVLVGVAASHDAQRLEEHQPRGLVVRSEEHTSELQSRENLVCRLLLV